jgi:hypothetical protein
MCHLNAATGRLENLMRRGCSVRAWLVVVADVPETAFVSVRRILPRLAMRRARHIIRRLIGISARGWRLMFRAICILGCHGADTSPERANVSVCRTTHYLPVRSYAATYRYCGRCFSALANLWRQPRCAGCCPVGGRLCASKSRQLIYQRTLRILGALENASAGSMSTEPAFHPDANAKFTPINSELRVYFGLGNQRAAMGRARDRAAAN